MHAGLKPAVRNARALAAASACRARRRLVARPNGGSRPRAGKGAQYRGLMG